MFYLFLALIAYSFFIYLCLHYKTHMRLKLLLIDNLIVIFLTFFLLYLLPIVPWHKYVLAALIVPGFIYAGIHIRFWRSPNRKVSVGLDDIASPADGKVIYIKQITKPNELVSDKKGIKSVLSELKESGFSPLPCWHIGINMTPFDVHKNCSPINGAIRLSRHFEGKFLSLKHPDAVNENERHSYLIEQDNMRIAVVQIASKRVRRIDSYVKEGAIVQKGEWLGMIRFGSQVDVFIPIDCTLLIKEGQQIFAVSTVIAKVSSAEGDR